MTFKAGVTCISSSHRLLLHFFESHATLAFLRVTRYSCISSSHTLLLHFFESHATLAFLRVTRYSCISSSHTLLLHFFESHATLHCTGYTAAQTQTFWFRQKCKLNCVSHAYHLAKYSFWQEMQPRDDITFNKFEDSEERKRDSPNRIWSAILSAGIFSPVSGDMRNSVLGLIGAMASAHPNNTARKNMAWMNIHYNMACSFTSHDNFLECFRMPPLDKGQMNLDTNSQHCCCNS